MAVDKTERNALGSWEEREMGRLVDQAMGGDRVGAMVGLSDWLLRGDEPEGTAVLRGALEGHVPVSLDEAEGSAGDGAEREIVAGLLEQTELLASVVRGLEVRRDASWIEVLSRSVVRLWARVKGREDRLRVCEAMVRLCDLQDDPEGVILWAHRGLAIEPTSAALAIALSKVREDPEDVMPTRVVLTRVARRWPGYRDVRAALIRRRADDGRKASARRMLERWLAREPEAPLARRLHEELTA